MARLDELRLMAKVARLYHGAGLRQTEITERLNIHQSTVSRSAPAGREGRHRPHHAQYALRSPSGARGRAPIGLRAARGDCRRHDRSGRSDRARPGRSRGLLSRDDAEADGCDRHLVVECGPAGDGGVDASEPQGCRRARGADSWRYRQPGRRSSRDTAHASSRRHGRRNGDPVACTRRRGIGRREACDAQGSVRPGGDGSLQVRHAGARRHWRRGAVETAGGERQRLLAAGAEVAERPRSGRRYLPQVLRCRRHAGRSPPSTIA